jgi:CheY-like chemotaxis protein
MIAELLRDEGYSVRVAAAGAGTLESLRGWRPDAIVLDVVMPGVDAPVFRALQVGMPEVADVSVLQTSATRAADLETIARDLGAAVAKPFDAEAFLNTVARLVEGPR